MERQSPLDKKLDELWDRLSSGGPSTSPGTGPSSPLDLLAEERAFLDESIARLRHRFAQEKAQWKQILAERDAAAAALKDQSHRLEGELARLREERETLRGEWETQAEVLSLERSEQEAEMARQARQHEKEIELYQRQIEDMERLRKEDADRFENVLQRRQAEDKAWQDLLHKKDDELAGLKQKVNEEEALRQKDRGELNEERRRVEKSLREEQAEALGRLQDLQAALETREEEVASFQKLLHLSQEEIAEFTRTVHGQEKELKIAQEQSGRLEDEIHTLREAWEAERGHWRELWERERASRERWYDNMRDWETHLRREREIWLSQFHAEAEARQRVSQKVERHVDRLREVVWSLPVFGAGGPAAGPAVRGFRLPSRVAAAAAGLSIALLLSAGTAWLFLSSRRRAAFSSPTPFLSGLTTHGNRLWLTDWMSGQVLEARRRRPERIVAYGVQSPDLHPVTLRWAEERLWSLDPWKRLLIEHRSIPPFTPIRSWPLPVNAPVDLAWDGQGFWVLDQTDPVLRRFPLGDVTSPDKEATLPSDWRLAALDYAGGEFWGYDESARRLRRFRLFPGLTVRAEYPLPVHEGWADPLTGLHVSGGRVWTVSEKSLKIFRWSIRSLAWKNFWRRKVSFLFPAFS